MRNLQYPASETYLQRHIAESENLEVAGAGTYQFRKFAKSIQFIRNFRHGVDVGANVGLWTRVMARLFTNVTSFEPVDEFADCIEPNLNIGDRVALHRCALGDKEGEVTLRMDAASSAFTHVMPTSSSPDVEARHAGHLGRPMEYTTRVVPVRTLDGFELSPIDFLKIDVEGFEYFVIVGGEQTIKRDRPVIIVEQKTGTADRYGLLRTKAVSLLERWGASIEFSQSGDYCMRWK